ncbi:MAG: UPF0158 family protein [Bacteroidia bacterium]
MITITSEQVTEIVDQHQVGFLCYLHKVTGELLSVPDMDKFFGMDTEAFDEDLEKLENNIIDYIEIKPPTSRQSFKIMESFVAQLDEENKLKNKLLNALDKKKPFREFNYVIENEFEFRQDWFAFRTEKLKQLINQELEEGNL